MQKKNSKTQKEGEEQKESTKDGQKTKTDLKKEEDKNEKNKKTDKKEEVDKLQQGKQSGQEPKPKTEDVSNAKAEEAHKQPQKIKIDLKKEEDKNEKNKKTDKKEEVDKQKQGKQSEQEPTPKAKDASKTKAEEAQKQPIKKQEFIYADKTKKIKQLNECGRHNFDHIKKENEELVKKQEEDKKKLPNQQNKQLLQQLPKQIDLGKLQINYFCVENDCAYETRMACSYCLDEFHANHKQERQRDLADKFKNLRNQYEKQQQQKLNQEKKLFDEYQNKFDQELQNLKNISEKIYEKQLENIKLIQSEMNSFFNSQEQRFQNQILEMKWKFSIDLSVFDIIHNKRIIDCVDKESQEELKKLYYFVPDFKHPSFLSEAFKNNLDSKLKKLNEDLSGYVQAFEQNLEINLQKTKEISKQFLLQVEKIGQGQKEEGDQQDSNTPNKEGTGINLKNMFVLSKIKMKLQMKQTNKLAGHQDYVWGIIKINSQYAISGGDDKKLIIWDIKEAKQIQTTKQISQFSINRLLKFNDDSLLVATGNKILQFNLTNTDPISIEQTVKQQFIDAETQIIRCLEQLNEQLFVSASCSSYYSNTPTTDLKIWNINQSQQIMHIVQAHKDNIFRNSLQVINENQFISVSEDKIINFWQINPSALKHDLLKSINTKQKILCCSLLKEQNILVTAQQNSLKVWDTQTFQLLSSENAAHTQQISDLKQTGARSVISTAWDRTWKIWSINEENKIELVRENKLDDGGLSVCIFDVRTILISLQNHEISLWK